jgi:hypothetical protein
MASLPDVLPGLSWAHHQCRYPDVWLRTKAWCLFAVSKNSLSDTMTVTHI